MRRLPTLLVLLAVAAMIRIGVWQLHRAEWKEDLLARYAAARTLPPIALRGDATGEILLFRRAHGRCTPPIAWTVAAGPDRAGRQGWRHLAACADGLMVDAGWTAGFADRPIWRGGDVSGVIAGQPEACSLIGRAFARRTPQAVLIVADPPAPGLAPSAPPDLAAVPNNHRAYAGQWFLFAGIALIIYLLALRRRARD